MAQAARLNLRMQKELKLLLTDPPPGASFPLLSADTDLFSLTTIDAQIAGPEGTVYANGIFNIRIQIPERYPFQPPIVTFATPIYHPNIDNGGRICLDILNLPPKGAWQPSLNISTVLTSIGLLLSEPNPDDGLMCEASREYKYNRQAFDQKARSITEKYAKGGAGGISFRSQCTQAHSNSSMMEFQRLGAQKQEVVNDPVSSSKKPSEVSQSLMLGSLASDKRRGRDNDEEENVVFNYPLSYSQHQMAVKGKGKELKEVIPEYNLGHKKQDVTKRNLSLNSSASCGKRERNKEKAVLHQSLVQSHNLDSLASFEASNSHEQQHHDDQNDLFMDGKRMSLAELHQVSKQQSAGCLDSCHDELCRDTTIIRTGSGSFNTKFPEICPVSKRLSLGLKSSSAGLENDDKENVMPILKLPTPDLQTSPKKSGNGRKLSLGPLTSWQGSDKINIEQVSYGANCLDTCNSLSMQHHCGFDGKEKSNLNNGKTDGGIQQQAIEESSLIPKELIVVDSEDSEAEDVRGTSRYKPSLVRKRMGKRRAQA